MKTIGLIGGMSWESTLEYYRIMNEVINGKLGRLHSAKCIIYSFDFEEIEKLQCERKWKELAEIMIDAAQKLEKAGVDFIVICTNTMHKVADDVQKNINIPLLHIVDVTAEKIKEKGLKKVGLLGTKFTMEEGFYRERLKEKHGIDVVIPEEREREFVHRVIYDELCLGIVKHESKEEFRRIIENLVCNGAEGIVLGCTEIPLLVGQEDADVPIFDTTTIHAEAAIKFALGK